MNHLIAKIRTRSNSSKYRKIFSGCSIFMTPDNLTSHIRYSPDHNLDTDSWFGITNFSNESYCIPILKDTFNSAEYDTLEKIDVDKLDYIISYQNNNEYHFQRVSRAQLVSKKFLHFGDGFRFEENSKVITINQYADAIYHKNNDIMYFKDLSSISTIFKGIDELYREATEEETHDFLNSEFIHLADDFDSKGVKKANRHRIAMAIDTLSNYEDEEKKVVLRYIKEYCPELKLNEDSFIINSDQSLKKLLYGIEQRYFTTPVKGEKRLANSIIAL